MSGSSKKIFPIYSIPVLIILTLFIALCCFLRTSPDKLIGAAFCHQIPSRSPSPDFPFCYRCMGLFCGIFFGSLYSIILRISGRFFSKFEIFMFILTLLLFLTDIVNKTAFFGIRIYSDNAEFRFFSAFPLGYTLVCLLFPIYLYLYEFKNTAGSGRILWFFCIMAAGCLISWISAFRTGAAGLWFTRIFTVAGSLGFVFVLYCILVKCAAIVLKKECHFRTASLTAFFLTLLQICLLGGIHLALIRFWLIPN